MFELLGKGGPKDLARVRELESRLRPGDRWVLVLNFRVKIPSFIADKLRREFSIRNLRAAVNVRGSRIIISGVKESPGPVAVIAVILGVGFLIGFLTTWWLYRAPKPGLSLAALGGAGAFLLVIIILLLLGGRRR